VDLLIKAHRSPADGSGHPRAHLPYGTREPTALVREDPRRASGAGHTGRRNDDPEHPFPLRPRARTPKERPELVGVPARSGKGILACDFFRVETVFRKSCSSSRSAPRRVYVTGATTNPAGAFLTQQARNLAFDREDVMTPVRRLVRDRDQKFSRSFDEVFTEGAKVILTPVRSPKANAFAELWVRTVRPELLDWTLVLGRRHLDRVLNTYVEHYKAHRPFHRCEIPATAQWTSSNASSSRSAAYNYDPTPRPTRSLSQTSSGFQSRGCPCSGHRGPARPDHGGQLAGRRRGSARERHRQLHSLKSPVVARRWRRRSRRAPHPSIDPELPVNGFPYPRISREAVLIRLIRASTRSG
jgi:hypothetical protein